jgi:hypothetical protein
VQAALKQFGSFADEAIMKELMQLHDKKVFVGKHFRSLSLKERRNIIRSSMFLKEKYDAMGGFEKMKARLVAGGDMQDKSLIEIMDQLKLEELPRYRFVAKVRKLSVKRIKLESSID